MVHSELNQFFEQVSVQHETVIAKKNVGLYHKKKLLII